MAQRINLKWPQRDDNLWLPWYTMIRRALFLPVFLVGIYIAYGGAVLCVGRKEAKYLVKDWL